MATMLIQPQGHGDTLNFPIQVEDFAFSIYTISEEPEKLSQTSAALLFCIEVQAIIDKLDQHLILQSGKSCCVAASEAPVYTTGRLARVFNDLN